MAQQESEKLTAKKLELFDLAAKTSAKDPIFKADYQNALKSGKTIRQAITLATNNLVARTKKSESKNSSSTSVIEREEFATGLRSTKEGSNQLYRFRHAYCKQERDGYYMACLNILTIGNEAVKQRKMSTPYRNNGTGKTYSIPITEDIFKVVHAAAQKPEYNLLKTQSNGGKLGAFEPYGCEGVVCALNQRGLETSPVTGSSRNSPSLVEYALNKINPKFTEELEKYCVMIKTHAYLALPSMSFGSLQRVVAQLNGVVAAFQKMIYSVYKGAIDLIKKFYAVINGIMVQMQKMMVSVIEQIIPLDLICLILETVQVIMDDINFFTSLFGQSGSIFNYLNTFQTYLNQASTLVSNPFTTLMAYMPPEVRNIIDMVDQFGSDPNGFLTDQLSNYGYGWALNAIQGDILGALINKYGAQYAAIGPVSQLLNSGEQYPRNMGSYPSTPAVIGPNVYGGKVVDSNNNPANIFRIDLKSLGISDIANNVSSGVSGAVGDLGTAVSDLGTAVADIPNDIGTNLSNLSKFLGITK